jgi:hypothetical protein
MGSNVLNVLGTPQLYAYIIGWWQYDVWWSILRSTGIFYLPIIFIFVKNIIEPFLSQDYRAGSTTALKRLVVKWVALVFILAFFVAPGTYINVNAIQFQDKSGAHNAFNNNSTFTEHLPDSIQTTSQIALPVGFYWTVNIINGSVAVAYDSLADDITVTQAQQISSTMMIASPVLRQEYGEFLSSCYRPAYASLMNDVKNGRDAGEQFYNDCVNKNGSGWGSKIKCFADMPSNAYLVQTYYPKYQAEYPVKGFPFIPEEDVAAAQQKPYPKYGRPMCDKWWSTADKGLRDRLYTDLNDQWQDNTPNDSQGDLISYYKKASGDTSSSEADIKNSIIQAFLQKSLGGDSQFAHDYYTENDYLNNSFGQTQASYGATYMETFGGFKAFFATLVSALPLIQMYLLIGIFAFLPIAALFSMYSFKYCICAIVVIFTTVSLTYQWHLVSYVHNILSLSFGVSSHLESSANSTLDSVTTIFMGQSKHSNDEVMVSLDIVATIFYTIFPAILNAFIAWGGFVAGSFIDKGVAGAESGGRQVQQGTSTVNNKVLSKVGL